MSTQTLAVGTPVSAQYGSFGGFSGLSRPSPKKQRMLILAQPGRGKSDFLQSIPGCFIINSDYSSTGPNTKAAVWPFVRASDGLPVEFNGSPDPEKGTPVDLTWAKILDKKASLIEAARKGLPRPEVIGFDTTDAAYPLIKRQMLEDYNSTADANKKKDSFEDLFGKSAYPQSYAHFIQCVRDLSAAGYGVFCVAQFGEKMVHLSDDQKMLKENVPQLPDNLYLPLKNYCETVALIVADDTQETKMVPQIDSITGKPRMRNGAPEMVPGPRETLRTFRMTFDRKQNQDLKARVVVPDLVIGKLRIKADGYPERDKTIDPWGVYEAAYNASIAAAAN